VRIGLDLSVSFPFPNHSADTILPVRIVLGAIADIENGKSFNESHEDMDAIDCY
jgi:hypothetical protein